MDNKGNPLQLSSVNHISLVCKSVEASCNFYQNVLGFVRVRRPGSLKFNGAWLFGHGIGVHLLQLETPENMAKKNVINPKDNHISFQCESMAMVEKKLTEMRIDWVRQSVEEGGVQVDQLFFHDPDGFMIEICNCENIPLVPLAGEMVRSCSRMNLEQTVQQQTQQQIHAPPVKLFPRSPKNGMSNSSTTKTTALLQLTSNCQCISSGRH